MKRFIIDENGKVLDELYEGDRITRKKQVDSYKKQLKRKEENMEGCFQMDYESFGIINFKEWKFLKKELKLNEVGAIINMADSINYIDCCVMVTQRTAANTSDLKEVIGISDNKSLKKIIDKLIKMNIVYKGRNGKQYQYFLNPWIIYKGDRLNKTLKRMFENYKIRSKGNICWKDLNRYKQEKK